MVLVALTLAAPAAAQPGAPKPAPPTNRGTLKVLGAADGGAATLRGARIVRFEPTRGQAGTRVRIFVEGLAPGDRILYGARPLRELDRQAGHVDVQIPTVAKSDFFAIQSGKARLPAAERFAVIRPPVIARTAPAYGAAGARVELIGQGFEPGDEVTFDGRPARMVEKMRPTRLVVQVPEGARTAAFTVQRMGLTFPARATFEILQQPVITAIEPTEGLPGTRVRITGRHFMRDTKVTMSGRPMRLVRTTPEALEVIVPPAVVSGPVTVATRGGRAAAPVTFLVVAPSEITGISPPAGSPGSQVTVRVNVLTGRDSFFFNGQPLKIVGRPAEGYLVVIPDRAVSDHLEWESFGVRRRSRFRFEVINPAVLTGLVPKAGAPGTRVTITGTHLGHDAKVSFGGVAVPLVERTAEKLVVIVPPNAVSNVFEVRTTTATLRTSMFTVVKPAPAPVAPLPRR
jgi:hypothetical protein